MKSYKNKKVILENDKMNDKNSKMTWTRMNRDYHYSLTRDKFNKEFWKADYDSDDIDDWFLTYCDIIEIKKQKERL